MPTFLPQEPEYQLHTQALERFWMKKQENKRTKSTTIQTNNTNNVEHK